MDTYKPEIVELLKRVEKKYAKGLNTTTDFEEFSLHLRTMNLGSVSASTMKRLCGYVNDVHTPRMFTLNVLSRYIGFLDFTSFCADLKTSPIYNSSFFSADQLLSIDLKPGDKVEIGWAPNRYILLAFKGNMLYEVLEVKQSKLEVGDSFEAVSFQKGQPLMLPYVLRAGQRTPPFIAGRNGGLTLINKL
jgi:hypothetical protein